MKEVRSRSEITFEVTLTLNEIEARALAGMTAYGAASFIKAYRKHLGKAIVPYESGLEGLFDSINSQIPRHLKRLDKTRVVWNNGE